MSPGGDTLYQWRLFCGWYPEGHWASCLKGLPSAPRPVPALRGAAFEKGGKEGSGFEQACIGSAHGSVSRLCVWTFLYQLVKEPHALESEA